MYSEQAYDLAFPEDPIKEYFQQAYKEIGEKYKPIIAEYDRLLEQFHVVVNNDVSVHNTEQKKPSTIFRIIYVFFEWIVKKVKSIFNVSKSYVRLPETKFPDSEQIKPFEMYESITDVQRLAREEKLKKYCLKNLSCRIDKSFPYEITVYDQTKEPTLNKNQVEVYCYIPCYSLIESIQKEIEEEQNNPTEDITYAYGGRGNQPCACWSAKLSMLSKKLEGAKNNLSVVYREIMCVNPMLFVETTNMPTATTRG